MTGAHGLRLVMEQSTNGCQSSLINRKWRRVIEGTSSI